jgi:hypothetical protein
MIADKGGSEEVSSMAEISLNSGSKKSASMRCPHCVRTSLGAKYPLVFPDRSGKASWSTSGVRQYLFSNEWRAVAVRSCGRPETASLLVRKSKSRNVSPVSRVERMRSCAEVYRGQVAADVIGS